ncbi:hypothetical protein Tco_1323543 [Tanacetum coccineum]
MVAYLENSEGSEGFHQIIDFLSASHINYVLTESPIIYASLIEQFWQTVALCTIEDGVIGITTTIDRKVKAMVTEASIRRHLKLEDSDGISYLPTVEIFEQLALIGVTDMARDRQKSYADKRRRPLEFEVGDKVIGPFKIIERIGPVAYHLELPQELSRVHNVFHICNLKKCLSDDTLVIPLEEIQLDDKLNFVKEPVEIMDREVKQLKRSRIPIIKVRWNARRGPEYTWEREDQFKEKYPHLFTNPRSTTTP